MEYETFKKYRFETNPLEKTLHDEFIEQMSHNHDSISRIVFPSIDDDLHPSDTLSVREQSIVLSTIQWLGSPVGQGFLRSCGLELKLK